jgi:RHS repeat-associated protein
MGRRIHQKTQAWDTDANAYKTTAEERYWYDGWNLIGRANAVNGRVDHFTWGLDLSGTQQGAGGVGGLLWMTQAVAPELTNGPASHYATIDGNGNILALINATDGTPSASYDYAPFGETLCASGPLGHLNPFRFSTKYQDDETDLLYYGYRYYTPSTGRWPSRDPIEEAGGLNLYGFLRNCPQSDCDRLGLSSLSIELFLEWLINGNGAASNPSYNYRPLDWSDFDSDGSTLAALKFRWRGENQNALKQLCAKVSAGHSDYLPYSGVDVQSTYFNDREPWISAYQAGAKMPTGGYGKVGITKDMQCRCTYEVTLDFWATDMSDFNPGESFGPWGVIQDDWFIAIKNNTLFGSDYMIGATKVSYLKWSSSGK